MNQERILVSKTVRFVMGPVARAVALFFGGFALLNLLGNVRSTGFDANIWWIDLRFLPKTVASVWLLLSSVCLLAYGLWPQCSRWRSSLTVGCAGALAIASLLNALQFYVLLAHRILGSGFILPFSLLG